MNEDRWLKSEYTGVCFHCGGLTDWIEINFEGYLHRECETEADKLYWEAVINGYKEV